MSFCPECGSNNEDGALFCGNCGKKLGSDVSKPKIQESKSKGKSILKIILYGIACIAVLFVGLIGYFMIADDNVKSETKVKVETQTPGQPKGAVNPQKSPASQQSGQAAQPANQAAAPVKIAAVDIGSGFESNSYRVIGKTDSLQAARIETIHAVVYVENVTSPITATGEWVYLGTQESVWTNKVTLQSDGAFHYELSKPSKGWPTGEFLLKVHINGQEAASKKFSVR